MRSDRESHPQHAAPSLFHEDRVRRLMRLSVALSLDAPLGHGYELANELMSQAFALDAARRRSAAAG